MSSNPLSHHREATDRDLIQRSREGARKILNECLHLSRDDALSVFYDETTEEPAKILLEEARQLGLQVIDRRTPLADQKTFARDGDGLGVEDREALSSARGILTCLSGHPGGTAYRLALVETGTDYGRRLGHIPGISLELLANAVNIDYEWTQRRCEDLALAMTLGQRARLRTYARPDGATPEAHDLDLDLGGLDRPPITSTGLIPVDTWGNLPGGESFIAPIEEAAEGAFVLNGSFKGHVVEPGNDLLLHFRAGRLERIDGNSRARSDFEALLAYQEDADDPSYNCLAELGVGVNEGIRDLTGHSLMDEKCAGTAHIAIGSNASYGGEIRSPFHEDLITRSPSLWIDGKSILDRGRLVFQPEDWRDTLEATSPDPELSDLDGLLTRTGILTEVCDQGTLRVRREVAAGRLCLYTLADPDTSRILARLYEMIPNPPQRIQLRDLADQTGRQLSLSEDRVRVALTILRKHRLIEIHRLRSD